MRRKEKRNEQKREGEGQKDAVCLFLPMASAALMDPAATGQSQGNLGFSCFDFIKIDSSPQTPDQPYGYLYVLCDHISMLNDG